MNRKKNSVIKASEGGRNFKAKVVSLEGKNKSIRLKALSRLNVQNELEQAGYEVKEIKERKKFTEIEFGKSVSQTELLHFTRQMSAFSAAGVPVLDSLNLLAESTKSKPFKKILMEISQDVINGETLTQSARRHEAIFPRYYLAILESSERTGDLTETFETLSSYLERDLASVRAVKSALYYPAILVTLSIGSVFVLSTLVLPKFAIFFQSLSANLPLSTRILMSISSFFSQYWLLMLASIFAIFLLTVMFARTNGGRKVLDILLLKMPIFGSLLKIIILERFTRVLSSLIGAGVPLTDSLELASAAMGNRLFSDALDETRVGVIQGEGLTEPLEKTGVFPAEAIQMLKVGEQSGHLTSQLAHASSYYAKEVDYKLKNLSTLIEPLVLIVVGGGVGFVAIALVSAMYGIYSSSSLNG